MTGPTGGDGGSSDGGTTGPGRTADLVDLWPGARPNRWHLLERTVELIEGWQGWFTHSDLHVALGKFPQGSSAAQQVIRTLRGHGLLERAGRGGHVRYRVRRAEP